MSFSKHERGDYITGKMEDIGLHRFPGQPDSVEKWSELWDIVCHEITTAGNPQTLR